MAEFRLTPAALRDLEEIWLYTKQQWGIAQAALYLDALNRAFEAMAQAPLSVPACENIRPGYRRRQVEHHAVYYRVEDGAVPMVTVVRVLHERMDASRHL
ncbi:MAG: type II toxin-antitoxin system RelE/ParE family toxin [Rhodocyclaceae bacterium]|jgi:toxin ParE1/3/4|nr:type II toxin-antitoxin system RelE/ParE family toxin [Rhodocyclaceae bacterium]